MKNKLLIFDNSNLNESYAGVTTPLTFSFARRVYSTVYREFSSVIGIDKKTIYENIEMYDEMLGFIGYRLYYNLFNWYKLISFIPGFKYNRGFLEKMLGVSKTYSFKGKSRSGQPMIVEYLLMTKQIIIIIWEFFRINNNVKKFLREFDQSYKKLNKLNLLAFDDLALIKFYQRTELQLSAKWRVTIVNDLAVMIVTGLSRKLFVKWTSGNESDGNELFREIKGIESVKVGNNFKKIVEAICSDKKALNLFNKNGAKKIYIKLRQDKKLSRIYTIIDDYLENFGDRSPSELKLESKTYKNHPFIFINLIKNQLQDGAYKESVTTNIKHQYLKQLPLLKKNIIAKLISLSDNYIKNREAARLRRSLVFGFARKVFLEIAKRMKMLEIIGREEDIFCLTVEEVVGIFNGTIVTADIGNLVTSRKKESESWSNVDLPQRLELDSNTLLFQVNALLKNSAVKRRDKDKSVLKGLICSIGNNGKSTIGEALVLKKFNPNVSYVGKILVTQQTDPGWTPVFPYLKAVIVERGGILSHAAVVAREYGLPCITQVNGATDFIVNGQEIEVDTKSGIITIL